MVRSRLLLAVVMLAACGRSDLAPDVADPPPTPIDPGAQRQPWPDTTAPASPRHLPGGAVQATAKVATLHSLFPGSGWLEPLEPHSTVTATLARPIDGALHHRFSGVLREGASWPDARDAAPSCPSVGTLTCVAYPWGKAYARIEGQALTLDVISHGNATAEAVLDATKATAPTVTAPALAGDAVIHSDNARLAEALQHNPPPVFESASLELTQSPQRLRARLRWTPSSAWSPRHSTAPAPSWDALCTGALACVRTGPWPNLHAWLQSVGTAEHPPGFGLTPLSQWSSTWPHALAATTATLRDRSPEVARGFINNALSGLAEVEFAGARLDEGGVFIAFVRIPASWVNFAASVLPYAGLTPRPQSAGTTEITWAPLPRGGIALALDDGPEPAMGWIVLASSPERFAWLMDAPRTRAGSSALTAQIARIDSIDEHVPQPWRAWLAPYAERSATLWVEVDEGRLSASIDLNAP